MAIPQRTLTTAGWCKIRVYWTGYSEWEHCDLGSTVLPDYPALLFKGEVCEYKKLYKIDDVKELAEYIQKIWIRRFNDKTKSFDEYIQIATNIKKVL